MSILQGESGQGLKVAKTSITLELFLPPNGGPKRDFVKMFHVIGGDRKGTSPAST